MIAVLYLRVHIYFYNSYRTYISGMLIIVLHGTVPAPEYEPLKF